MLRAVVVVGPLLVNPCKLFLPLRNENRQKSSPLDDSLVLI